MEFMKERVTVSVIFSHESQPREDVDSWIRRITEVHEHETTINKDILTYIPCRITLPCIKNRIKGQE